MATVTLVPRTVYNGSSSYLMITSSNNMLTDTSSTTYGTVQCTRTSTSSYYVYLRNFDWSLVPSDAVVSNITIKVKGYHSGGNTGTLYMYNGTSTQVSACGSGTAFTTSSSVITFTNTTISWDTLKNYGTDFGVRINCRRSSRNTANTIYIYGAEIDVTYTIPTPVSVTGVTLDQHTATIDEGETLTLTPTVSPSDASNKNVTWSSSNTAKATVSGGVVTGVSAGTATITVTTVDGGYTDTCVITVTAPTYTQYKLATSMEVGKRYIIANGDSGTVYMLTDEANGSRTLLGLSATVSNGIISITGATASRVLFDCVRYTSGNDVTITVEKNNKYLYSDNSTGLRMNAPATLDRFWHYRDNKFWQFKSTSSDGYTDTSSEYKYYLTWSNGNATDNHVSTTSIADSNIPLTYIYTEYVPSDESAYIKVNGAWIEGTAVYKKVNGSWVEQSDLSNVFVSGTNYKVG